MAQRLQDIMNANVSTCQPEDSMQEAARQMASGNVGAIPVVSNDQLIGMITDRDIVIRGVAQRKPDSTPISEIMSEELVCGTPDMSIDEAAQLMAQHQIRRLPVVEGTKLVGIVALGDLAVRDQFDDEAEQALSEISEIRSEEQAPPGNTKP